MYPGDPYSIFVRWGDLSRQITRQFDPRAIAAFVGPKRSWLPSSEQVPFGGVLGLAIAADGTRVFGGLRENAGRFEQLPLFAGELVATSETALFARGDLKVNDRVHVIEADGSPSVVANAGGDANIGVDAVIGRLWSSNSVTLRDGASVIGSIRVGGALTRAPTSGQLGVTIQSTAFDLPNLSTFSVPFPTRNAGPVSVAQDVSRALPPGAYGDLDVATGGTLTLSAGRYYFENATLQPQAHLMVDSTQGPVFAYVHSSLLYNGTIADTRGVSGEFFLGYLGTEDANINAPFTGTLVVPNAKVSLISSTSPGHVGSFFAKSLEIHQDSVLTHQPFAHPWEFGSVEPPGFEPNAAHPAARTDFGAVFSSSRSEVFVVGGALASGALTGEIWTMTVSEGSAQGGQWRQLPVGEVLPGKVLAATYRADDQSLYWVDEGSSIRLVRYSLKTNSASILSILPRATNFDQLFLTVSTHGDLLLATSNTSASHNCAALVSPAANGMTVKWGLPSTGVLSIAPSLTEQGLFLKTIDSTPFGTSAKLIPSAQLPTAQSFNLATCL